MTIRIGLLWPQTSGAWTAGGIYAENLLKSVRLVAGAGIDVVVFEPVGGDFSQRGSASFPDVPLVTFDDPSTRSVSRRVAGKLRRSLGMSDSPMAAAAREAGIGVVFGNVDMVVRDFVPWVAWIPDFQQLHYPEFFAQGEIEERHTTYLRWAQRASLVMLSSRDCEKDFDRFAPTLAGKARVAPFVSLFPDEYFERDAAEVAEGLGIAHPYVVVPNQWWRHKNHETALRAAKRLKDAGSSLTWVFTGAMRDYRDEGHPSRMMQLISDLGLTDTVRTLGAIPRADQVQLLRDCDLVVHPSLFEGWSTVVEDAKTIGQRMVISDLAVHREQEPRNALYFEALSAEGLAGAVTAALDGAVERIDETSAREATIARARVFGERFVAVCAEAAKGA